MTVSKPQNREEFKQHILTKLGAPVLQINVADEQLDIAIDDAFQFFNERNHFNGVERMYLTTQIDQTWYNHWKTYHVDFVDQPSEFTTVKPGMVKAVQLVEPGSGYPQSYEIYQASTDSTGPVTLGDEGMNTLTTDPSDDAIIMEGSGGSGKGLTLKVGYARTVALGILDVSVYATGSGYKVGDVVTINGGDNNAVIQITEVSNEAPSWGTHPIRRQNNWIKLPDDVVGVTKILKSTGSFGLGGGIIPPGSLYPVLLGGLTGDSCNQAGFGLITYYAMMQYLALIEFMFIPPRMYNFNQRTHRLFIDGDLGTVGTYICLEVMVKPSPDVFPDLWNDMWLKQFATALVKAQWGRNLTKYNQVQLPGGIVINGDRILQDAQQELETLRTRFAMDFADPPLDEVG